MTKDLKIWVADRQGEHSKLKSILNDPTFKAAVELAVKELDRPTYYGTDATLEVNALQHAEEQGQKKLLGWLELLASPPKEWQDEAKEKKPLPPPYDYLKGLKPKVTTV